MSDETIAVHAVMTVLGHAGVSGGRVARSGRRRRCKSVMQYGDQQQGSQHAESASHNDRLRRLGLRCKAGRAGGLPVTLRE
jgi:hypothetical protein